MASKLKLISELYEETIKDVSHDSRQWLDFLKCASMNYKYNFSEQLLIYAQKPNAIACADLETWNKTLNRWINKGAKGIALLDEQDGNLKLKYVFDVSDTHSRYKKNINLWRVNKVYEEQVIESLENRYGDLENKADINQAIQSVSVILTEDNYVDYFNDLLLNKSNTKLDSFTDEVIEDKYKDLLSKSISYMILNRCGFNPDPHYVNTDFSNISLFDNIETITRVGTAISDISEMALREIYATLKNIRIAEIEKIRTFDEQKDLVYDNNEKGKSAERSEFNEHNLHKNWGLSTTESISKREEESTTREVLNDEVRLSEETSTKSISSISDGRQVDRVLERDREHSTNESELDNGLNDETREHQRENESERPNEMGWVDEQHQEYSRGNGVERTDLQLKENTENSIPFSLEEEYEYKVGDTVSIGLDEYIIDKIGTFDIELYNPKYPLFGRTMNIVEFETKMKENPANDHLIKEKDIIKFYDKNDGEIGLLYHILNKHKVNDIELELNEDGNLVAYDGDNAWDGIGFYDFLFDSLFVYNEDGEVDLLEDDELDKLKEYREHYRKLEENKKDTIILTEKEKEDIEQAKQVIDLFDTKKRELNKETTSQLSLFVPREQELADRILNIFNSFDTKYKDTFYIDGIELKTWDHIKSKKRHLTIHLKSKINTEFNNPDYSFTAFNKDKTDEIFFRECTEFNEFLKHLDKDKDFGIRLSPDTIYIFYQNFDDKNIDFSIGQNEVLLSTNKEVQEEIIDNLELPKPIIPPKKREKISNYVLHPEIPYEERINYKITDKDLGAGTESERFRNNIEAIRTLKKCEEEDRYATPEEQEVLARYVGWGGLSRAFDKEKWESAYNELEQLLTPDEFRKARDSVTSAFYTPPTVISAMYKALSNMGLEKGNILEPSCGIGNFIGLLPNNEKLKIYGVEIDDISGRIARQLYQKSSIAIQGFEKTEYSNSFFDVAIGNVPFGVDRIYDKKYDKHGFLIHDYFFAKTIDKVRPGGIIAFVTSKGTMDKEGIDVRKYIAQRADLLGAIRLPNNTFKKSAGTEVTSDIIFLQKRESITDILPDWVSLDTNEDGIKMNKYFVDHPEMVLGNMKMVSGQYGQDVSVCEPYEDESLEDLLETAVSNIHAEIKEYQLEDIGEEEDLSIEADLNVKNFSYAIVDNKVYYRENSRMYPQELALTTENRVRGLIEIRDCVRELINLQLYDYPDEDIKREQEKLNNLYDKFIKKYGLINSRGNSTAFSNDSSYFLLCSLEILDENKELKRKADIFHKRTIRPHNEITKVNNSSEALLLSISEKASVDLDYMSKVSNISKEDLIKDLEGVIFRIPDKDNQEKWVNADEYLSGNVRDKLDIAEEFAKEDPRYNINVKCLKEVLPKDIETSEISVRFGATWIPEDVYQDFMYELLESSYYARRNTKIHYSELNGEWNIEGKNQDRYTVKVTSTYGTSRANAYRLFEDGLNLRDTRIFDYKINEEGKKEAVLNKKETAIAQAKQEQIKAQFAEWIWKDPDRRERLTKLYNRRFNSIRPREYDGSHIKFNGMNPEIKLRTHQVNAIARILYGGNTLLAHEVGAGKTFEMVAAAMESKRLGLCNKSLFVVPNHIIEQFASEFLQLYPSANILVSTKKDFETANRKKFCSRIATGDYDAIIIGHSQFERIPMSVERQEKILRQQLDDISNGIVELKNNGGERFSIKMLVRSQKSIERKLEKLNSQERKDDVITFEELGVDRLFVDEAHYYKNLYLYTKMRNVGGIAQTEAQKSSDLFMKCRYLDELTNNKGVIFATGTPISNSMVELYTLQRYLQYDTLLENKLQHFDAWASTFGETITAIELAPEGTGYRSKTRFAKFYNLPELMSMFKEVADIQTADTLKLPLPTAHYTNVVIKPSDLQVELVKSFSERAEKVRNREVDASVDNMLKITNDGRKLALDQRLIDELLPDYKDSKVDVCSQNIFKIWEENKEQRLAQLLFCDLSTPKNDGTFNVYDDIRNKLIEKGVPEDEIEFIHNANTETRRKELFAKVRQGKVRILIGSTPKMGAGTNCQDKLLALHDLDCPWRPSDLTQRSGRIIRQGNQNDDVYIYRYVTEKTFDAYLYQLVENKQKFISQIMTSKTPVRSAEDIDEVALSYAEIKALAAGNPLIIEKTELDSQVSKLKLLKQSHLSQIYELEDKVRKFYPEQIKNLENRIEKYKLEIEVVNNNIPNNEEKFLSMTINDKKYLDKKEAGTALTEELLKNPSTEPKEIGEYRGFKLEVWYDPFFKQHKLNLKNNLTHTVEMGASPSGNLIRIDNVLASFQDKLDNCINDLATAKEQLIKAKEEINRPFPQEQELKEKSERLEKLNILLNLNEKTNEIIDDKDELEEDNQPYKSDYER